MHVMRVGYRMFFMIAFAWLILSAAVVADGNGAERGSHAPPNILFILTEDQGAQMSAYGTVGLNTPNMDAIAQRGVLFTQAFVDVPVCSASKAAIYTGLHGHANGIPTNTPNFFKPAAELSAEESGNSLYRFRCIPENVPTLIEILHDANYYMRVTGKLHVAPNEKFPYDQWGPATPDTAAEFLGEAKSQQRPWFLWYNIGDPHRKFTDSDRHPIRVAPDQVEVPPFLPDTPIVRQDLAEYYDAIERADDKVGAVLEVLQQNGDAENTIVVFMGDHGPSFQRGKMSPYDYGLRVPLIFTGPSILKGVVSNEVVGAIDLMSTLLDLVGLKQELPAVQHGLSIRPLLEGQSGAHGHEYLVSEVQHEAQRNDTGMRERSIYDGRYRLIYRDQPTRPRDVNADISDWEVWGNRTYAETVEKRDQFPMQFEILAEIDNGELGGEPAEIEVYDLKNDPNELNNLAHVKAMQSVVDRLRHALSEWAKQTGDQSLVHIAKLES